MDTDNFDPTPGAAEQIAPGIRRILAPNPSPMTFRGTNTYLVGEKQVAVIDPGPAIPSHQSAILDALRPGEAISHILVTHAHLDHSPLAAPLAAATGAPVCAFGDCRSGRSKVMEDLANAGLTAGGEGVDTQFSPDERLADGDNVETPGWRLEALWTPGHFGNHLCFALEDAVFTGDQVMGWASTMVSPPDGDLSAFMASTKRLAQRNDRVFFPGHGAPITNPAARANWLLDHRRNREAQILSQLGPGGSAIADLTRAVYCDAPAELLFAAERNVFAHLIDLHGQNRVRAKPHLARLARFYPA